MCEHGLKTYYVSTMHTISCGFSVSKMIIHAKDDIELASKLDDLYEKEKKVCIFFKELNSNSTNN